MGKRRRKNRTHLKDPNNASTADTAGGTGGGTPKSFIVKHGQVGSSISQLVRDMRKVMEPNTATRLRERSRNKLKDYLTLAPALSVTHIMAFTLTPLGPSLRIIRLTAGPTLSFRVERYSLVKDILNASRRARSIGMEYLSPPLLVLASFPSPGPGVPSHIPLLVKFFQSLFPPLAPKTLSLSSARRIVLISYNSERGTIDFRHYLITVRPYGISRRIRKVLEGASKSSKSSVLDLGKEQDVADYLLRKAGEDGYESASTSAASEADPEEVTVKLADDYVGRNNRKGEKRAVRLDEIGPRMELRLVKITEGLPGKEGGVIFHEFIKKSPAQVVKLKAEAAEKQKLRQQRREEQERNVARKKRVAEGRGEESSNQEDEDEDMEVDGDEGGKDDDEWGSNEEFSEGEEEGSDEDDNSSENGSESEVEAPLPKRRPPSQQPKGRMSFSTKIRR